MDGIVVPSVMTMPRHVPLSEVLELDEFVTTECAAVPVDTLRLSGRPSNCLKSVPVNDVRQILSFSLNKLYAIPALGQGSAQEIIRRVCLVCSCLLKGMSDAEVRKADLAAMDVDEAVAIRVHERVKSRKLPQDSDQWSVIGYRFTVTTLPVVDGSPTEQPSPDPSLHPHRLRDEWNLFSFGAGARGLLKQWDVVPEWQKSLHAVGVKTLGDLLDWTWAETVERLGDEGASDLLDDLVREAQEYAEDARCEFVPNWDVAPRRVEILEDRWSEVPLGALGLSMRAVDQLDRAGIQDLGGLLNALDPLDPVLAWNLAMFEEVWTCLVRLELRAGDALQNWDDRLEENRFCLDGICGEIEALLKQREWDALIQRVGLIEDRTAGCQDIDEGRTDPEGQEDEGEVLAKGRTLEAVAIKLGLTREGVRQLEQKALVKLREAQLSPWQSLACTLEYLFQMAGGVMSLREAAAELTSRFSVGSCNPLGLCALILQVSDAFSPTRRRAVYGLTSVPAGSFDAVVQRALETCRASLVKLDESDLVGLVQQSLEQDQLPLPLELVSACIRADGRFSSGMVRRDLSFLILETLRDLGGPAHFTEIAAHFNKLGWRSYETTSNAIHSRLSSARDLFSYLGPGTYGLSEWGIEDCRLNRDNSVSIGDAIEEFLTSRDDPADFDEITAHVLSRKLCRETSISMALCREPRFHRFGRGRYGLTRWVQ